MNHMRHYSSVSAVSGSVLRFRKLLADSPLALWQLLRPNTHVLMLGRVAGQDQEGGQDSEYKIMLRHFTPDTPDRPSVEHIEHMWR